MIHGVFNIYGDKICDMIIDEDELKFSNSNQFFSYEDYKSNWQYLSRFDGKFKIKLKEIRSIKSEMKTNEIRIFGISYLILPFYVKFRLENQDDFNAFISFFGEAKTYVVTTDVMTPIKAIKNQLIFLGLFAGLFFFGLMMRNENNEISSGKNKLIYYFFEKVDLQIVVSIGILITMIIIYQMYQRLKKRPKELVIKPIK